MFRALVVERGEDGATAASVQEVDESRLPPGEVLVDVAFSTVNYKDGLCLAGKAGLVRTWPHVPGIDFAGTVAESADPRWQPGDRVVLTGWRVGETRWGGYAERARVPADWLVPLPEGLSLRQTMAIGTAGFTAMLAVIALEDHGLSTQGGPVLVTGAAGGVGSIAVALLSRLGYEVVAVTGRPESAEHLRRLGARRILSRAEMAGPPSKPLDAATWAGCVDAVGGSTLATVLTQMKLRGSVAAVGNAGGAELHTTVIPFLLRGVNLLGIDSVMQPFEARRHAWDRLARDLDLSLLDGMTGAAALAEVPAVGAAILRGEVQGRVVVDVRA